MGAMNEFGGEFLKFIAMLGGILAFVGIFLLWSSFGTWAVAAIAIVLVAGYFGIRYMVTGGFT